MYVSCCDFMNFSYLPLFFFLKLLFNVAWFERESKRSMSRFRRRINRRRRTKCWDNNRPTRIYNRHYTDLFNSISKQCYLHFFFVLLWFFHPLHRSVYQLLQSLRLALHPNIVNTIATNLSLHSINLDIMHSHITPLTDVVQARCASLHLTINKIHR